MAYSVSNDFRTKAYSGESIYRCTLTIDGNTIPYEQIEYIKISDPIVDSESEVFYLGTFIAKQITIKFRNLANLTLENGLSVDLTIGQYVNNAWEDVPIGKFLIDDLGEDYQTTCEIVCLDYSIKFKPAIDYSPCFVDGKATIDTILAYICSKVGVTLGTYPSTNGTVETSTYDSTVSGKQWVSYIAELKGCNAKIDRTGKLTLVPLKSNPVVTIDALASAEWELGDRYELTKLVFDTGISKYSRSANPTNADILTQNSESLQTEDEENLIYETPANTLYLRQGNPFLNGIPTPNSIIPFTIPQVIDENSYKKTIDNIFDVVKNTVIYNIKVKNYGDISLDGYDTLAYTLGNETYRTLNNGEITYQMTIMSQIETKIPTKLQEDTTNINGTPEEVENKSRARKLETLIDIINNQYVLKATDDGKIAFVKIKADAETGSEFEVQADSINFEGKTFNLTTEDIAINSTNFNVDKNGNLTCSNATVSGTVTSSNGTIAGWSFDNEKFSNGNYFINKNGYARIYVYADLWIIQMYLQGTITFTQTDIDFYDQNGDGVVDIRDLLILRQKIVGQ